MEYSIQKMGKLAGVSTRTLRYYDEIGILKPVRINSSGYRIYGQNEVDRLQQILFYRELGFGLENIKEILASPQFDQKCALKQHREKLLTKRNQLDLLIETVTKSIAAAEGSIVMTDMEKFEGLKQKLIDENERKYGREIRQKYGDAKVDRSNNKFRNMTAREFEEFNELGENVLATLKVAYETGDPSGKAAQEAAELHKRWLSAAWGSYSKDAHAALAEMYVQDPRFTAFYDRIKPGCTEFLKDAILIYTGKKI